MTNICVIFRGEHIRQKVNIDLNIQNWQRTIFDSLKQNNYTYDLVFITYESPVLNDLKLKLNPKEILTYTLQNNNIGQVYIFNKVNNYISDNINNYDRFVILRFDIVYNISICNWYNWDKSGIILPSKDATWCNTKLYNDIIFIIDSDMYNIFNNACKYMLNINDVPKELRYCHHDAMPHHIGQYLYLNNNNIILIYDEILDGLNHPLYKFSRNTNMNDKIYLQ